MSKIQKMEPGQSYEILDLWLRCTADANPFFESDFWQKNYEEIKEKYLTNCRNYVYTEGSTVIAFICITDTHFVNGLFVEPDCRGRGIGRRLLRHVKTCYDELHLNIYAKSRKMLNFVSNEGFLIDGALYQEESNQVKYTLTWKKRKEQQI